MTEFKVMIEDELVAALGEEAIEKSLRNFVEHLNLKAAAQDALAGLDEIDLENDLQWQIAREEAWKEYQIKK